MGRAYKNPTEDMALGHIMLEEKKKRRREMRKRERSPDTHSRIQYNGRHHISVWREEESGTDTASVEVTSHAGK